MHENFEPRLLRWRDTHELFNMTTPLLVFLIDYLDEQWATIPADVRAMLDTMASTAATPVRVFEVDYRVDPDFLALFRVRPGVTVVRRLAGADTFDLLRHPFSLGELIEFCRGAYEERARPRRRGHELAAAAGEIVLADQAPTAASGEIVLAS